MHPMEQISETAEARRWVQRQRRRDDEACGRSADDGTAKVAVVPTMGALHEGHLALVRAALKECGCVIVSVFVNPTQFGPGEDLDRYPRSLREDVRQLERAGAGAVFIPSAETIYPEGFSTYVEPPAVARKLEGAYRPGHFRGVCTIVLKLFHILPASHAWFGKKDYQQWRVIEAMARDLSMPIEIVAGETVREPDGMAMSSRNRYLSPAERRRGPVLYGALKAAAAALAEGQRDGVTLQRQMVRWLRGEIPLPGYERLSVDWLDYVAIVDAQTMRPLETIDRPAVALVAARIGDTRLIDNLELIPPN